MIRKSMPSGYDPMGGHRFSEKIMLKIDASKKHSTEETHERSRSSKQTYPPRLSQGRGNDGARRRGRDLYGARHRRRLGRRRDDADAGHAEDLGEGRARHLSARYAGR